MRYRLQVIVAVLCVGCSYAADKNFLSKDVIEHKESDKKKSAAKPVLSYALEATLTAHRDSICSLHINSDNTLLTSRSVDGAIKKWSMITKTIQTTQQTYRTRSVNKLTGASIVFGSKKIQLSWGFESGGKLCSAVVSPDKTTLAQGCQDGSIKLFNAAMEEQQEPLKAHDNSVTAVAFSYDGNYLISGSYEIIKVWRKQYQFQPSDEDGLAQFLVGPKSVKDVTDLVVNYVEPGFFYKHQLGVGEFSFRLYRGEVYLYDTMQRLKALECRSTEEADRERKRIRSAIVFSNDRSDAGVAIVKKGSFGDSFEWWMKTPYKMSLWKYMLMYHRAQEQEMMRTKIHSLLCLTNRSEQDKKDLEELATGYPDLYKECCKRYAMKAWGADS